ncbi:MAG: hypothetical protein M1365_13820 [Actinobacteria bacterium]|nr:hypothetical protein [Actinomycetota bacterium]
MHYIVLHKDIAWNDKNTYGEKTTILNPLLLENILNNLDFLQKEQQFGDLIIYKIKDLEFRDILSIPSSTQIVYPGQTDIMQILSLTNTEQDIITPYTSGIKDFINDRPVVIFPDKSIKYQESTKSATVAEINEVFNGQLLGMRNYFYSIGYLQSLELTNDLISSTEKILSIYQQALTSRTLPASEKITDYQSLMKKIFARYYGNTSINNLFEEYIRNDLKIHLLFLRELGQNDTAKMLENFMVDAKLLPIYREQFGSQNIDRQVFKFKIPRAGSYQLLPVLSLKDSSLRVNGEKVVSIDNLPFEAGDYEISLDIPDKTFNNNTIALKMKPYIESSSGGQIVAINKDSPVKYDGKIHLDKPSFIMFSQSFHPGWILTLFKDGKPVNIREHLLGNLYSNAWWVNDQGDFDFRIEFEPQRTVTAGVVLSGFGWIVILAVLGLNRLRRKL